MLRGDIANIHFIFHVLLRTRRAKSIFIRAPFEKICIIDQIHTNQNHADIFALVLVLGSQLMSTAFRTY
jgi:hypothetical protein